MKKRSGIVILLIILLLSTVMTAGCSSDNSSSDEGVYTSISELSGKRIGIQILMSVLKDPAIHVTIEYDQPQEAAEMTVEYPGNFRIEKASKTLPYAVLMANSESVVQETLPDGSKSTVKVRIK